MTEQSPRPLPVDLTEEGAVRGFFAVDPRSDVPPYSQLRRRVIEARGRGTLAPGTRLPPVRRLAIWLDLAPNTVAKAYRELEAAGVIETRGRSGSFVRAASDAEERALALTREYLKTLRGLGLTAREGRSLLDRVLEEDAPG
ncbi:GntR family transcriptional regulator [Rothia sp. AR01]|uniref:GntR family transcriptional regulator n=1 Tax=Rothia santali TaxID=2949643 RepID=A0A9X2KK77_9MICC|nr:GntR family transcriptional regulator [Rothia santali]MCP3424751.1 GntR family transcriptional regulator [Rothia santali]